MIRLFWAMFAVAMGIYLVMVLWTLPAISAAAGGLPVFDLRPRGYGPEEARAFLVALDEAGRALYLGPQAGLDLIYPGLLALVLALGAHLLLRPGWKGVQATVIVFALAGSGFDYIENIRVRALLLADPGSVSTEMIAGASRATMLKSGLSSVAFVLFLLALVIWLWQRVSKRRAS